MKRTDDDGDYTRLHSPEGGEALGRIAAEARGRCAPFAVQGGGPEHDIAPRGGSVGEGPWVCVAGEGDAARGAVL